MSSKRFIDNSILPKSFRKLEPSLKVTWYYLWNNCDEAGVWDIDKDLFEFENGFEFDIDSFQNAFEKMIEISGEKILLKDFILINNVSLKENYNPHKPVFRAIYKNNLKLEPSLNQASFKLVGEGVGVGEGEGEGEGEDYFSLLLSFLDKAVNSVSVEEAYASISFHNAVYNKLIESGYNCDYEYPIQKGRIDILVHLLNGKVAIELDNRTPRGKNLMKVEGLNMRIVSIIRNPYPNKSYSQFNVDGIILYRNSEDYQEPDINYDEILKIFNEVCVDLPKVQKITKQRKQAINARAKEFGLEKIGEVFTKVSQTPGLNGNNEKGWKADFDWILGPQNFIKILEGKYDQWGKNNLVIGRMTEDVLKQNLDPSGYMD